MIVYHRCVWADVQENKQTNKNLTYSIKLVVCDRQEALHWHKTHGKQTQDTGKEAM